MSMELALLVIAGFLLVAATCVLTLHKTRRVHLMQFTIAEDVAIARREVQVLYAQIEALMALDRLLHLDAPLPALRGWAGSPDFLLVLARHVRIVRPRRILECSSGASTIVLARSLQLCGSGHLFSLEHDPLYAEKTRAELALHGLLDWATVVEAPLIEYPEFGQPWYSIERLPSDAAGVEMLVVDGPPRQVAFRARLPALPVLRQRLAANCVTFLDDADRTDEQAIVADWLRRYPELAAEELSCEKGCIRLAPRPLPLHANRAAITAATHS